MIERHRPPGPMRVVAFLLLLAGTAGCIDPAEPRSSTSMPEDGSDPAASYPFGGMTEYCLDNETCDFWDHQFHEGAVYEMDTLVLEAVVLPVPGADAMVATATARMATAGWQNVTGLALPWFAEAF